MEKQKKLTKILKKEIINPIKDFKKNYKPSLTDYLICGGVAAAANIYGFLSPESKGAVDNISKMGCSPFWGYALLSYWYTIASATVSIPLTLTIGFIQHQYKISKCNNIQKEE